MANIDEKLNNWTDKLRYDRSFLAKLALSDDNVKQFYADIATELLSYDKVKSRTRWSGVAFSFGRNTFARIAIVGKTLSVYLAVEPTDNQEGKYRARNVGDVKKYEKTPSMYKVKSEGALRNVIKLIGEIAARMGLTVRETLPEPVSPKDFPSDNFGNLVTRGLIRLLRHGNGKRVVVTDDETAATDIDEAQPDVGETEQDDEVAMRVVGNPLLTDVYADAVDKTEQLCQTHKTMSDILGCMSDGESVVSRTKRKLLRAIDESWVTAVEGALEAMDWLVRNPTHYIAETEEILPIEMTKKITGRSVVHLCQHTNFITTDGNDIIPKKILNVFRDDSLMTYENKFLNTLIARLAIFVKRRYDIAVNYGVDELVDELNYETTFEDGDAKGKVTINVSYSVPNTDKAANSLFGTELWRRIERVNTVTQEFLRSDFVAKMERRYVNPPILRTNAIVKNKYFRQCLALWDFIERYDDAGYGLVVEENALDVPTDYAEVLGKAAATQYMMFMRNVSADYLDDIVGSYVSPKLNPRLETRFARNGEDDFTEVVDEDDATEEQRDYKFALEVAVAADEKFGYDYGELVAEAKTLRFGTAEVPTNVDEQTAEEEASGELWWNGIRYVKTFHAKIRLAEPAVKDDFLTISNALLGYDRVKLRESNRFATFNRGRTNLARINVVGKTLYVYFALDPEAVDAKYHVRNVSDRKSYADTPTLLRVRSVRALKYALELVDQVCLDNGAVPTDNPSAVVEEYTYRPVSLQTMLENGWIREVKRGEVTDDGNDITLDGVRYHKTFHAKIRLAPAETKQNFVSVANMLLGYDRVKMRESNRFATFNRGRQTLARLGINGKTLCLYLAVYPAECDPKMHVKDVGKRKSIADTPSLVRLRSSRAVKYASELIQKMFADSEIALLEKPPVVLTEEDYKTVPVRKMVKLGWIRKTTKTDTDQFAFTQTEASQRAQDMARTEAKYWQMPPRDIPLGVVYDNSTTDQTTVTNAGVLSVSPDVVDAEIAAAEQAVEQIDDENRTLPDVVQVQTDYSDPTKLGLDDASNYIADSSAEAEDEEEEQKKGLFAKLFGIGRKKK